MKRNLDIKKLCLAAVFAALTFVGTYFFAIPILTVGYVNLGDCFVVLSGLLLGTVFGPLAAGIGSALADILLGYTIYAPATLIIKALAAFTAAVIIKRGRKVSRVIVASVAAEAIILVSYFLYDTLLFGLAAAAPAALSNLFQCSIGAVSASIIGAVLTKRFIK